MKYELKKFSAEEAKKIIKGLVADLSGIDPDDLTEFEQHLLAKCTINPPKFRRVREVSISHIEYDSKTCSGL